MKKEELFEAIGNISSQTIERNAIKRNVIKRKAGKVSKGTAFRKWMTIAASFVALTGIGLLSHYRLSGSNEDAIQKEKPEESDTHMDVPREELPGREQPETQESAGGEQQQPETFVDISTLLADGGGDGSIKEEALRMEHVDLGAYAARYDGVLALSDSALQDSIGEALNGNEGWYKVSGHEEAQYLIHVTGEEYTLWKFSCFRSGEYAYKDVLQLIYGLNSADDILSVSITAANMDSTDAGKKIQEEIGEYEIRDKAALKQIYDILCGLTCYGDNRWDLIDYGGNDESMTESVRSGRYLTLRLDNGVSIDTLKYTAVSGMFYEYGGIAYNRLSASDKEFIDRLFGIEMPPEDAPADENMVYQDAHRYSDEIEGIQSAISQAMSAGELPFVISSAIYENPVRIVVTVNTKDEASLEKVKAYDTAGGVIELVYSENRQQLE